MTDSESDIDDMLPNNIYSFQSGSMMVSAKGPNIMHSFQSNLTSTTNMQNMPRNLNRAYAQSTCDQRSIGYRRETSPMSLYSFSERRPHNYRGTFSGRARSPTMSIRTMDSNISAIDIAAALKSKNFNKKESRRVAHECSMYLKRYQRARVEKRRQFQKRVRHISGYDSGELASDSSMSSDDRRSTKTCRTAYRSNTSRSRSTRTDFADFRRTMMESNMYRDCTNDLSSLRNVLPDNPRSVKENILKRQMLSQSNTSMMSQKNSFPLPSQGYNEAIALLPISEKENRNTSVISQKDRFKNGFLLPSKRFNQSTASLPIPETEIRRQRHNIDNNMRNVENPNRMRINHEIDSEQEEIFSETTEMEKTVTVSGKKSQSKRSLDPDEHICIPNKRNKLSSPLKKTAASESSVVKQTNSYNDQKRPNDFEFVKPQFPIKKLGKVVTKSQLTKKLPPKPALQPAEKIISNTNQQSSEKSAEKSKENPQKSISSQKSREKVTSQSGQKSTEKVTSQSVEKSTEKVAPKSHKNTQKETSKSSQKPIEKLISKSTQHLTETLISKSAQQPTEIVISKSSQPIEALDQPAVQIKPQTKPRQEKEQAEDTSQFSTTDMSMRPSFIKRKLFTQKVDTESKNSSSDNLTDSSQSNIYSAIQKEKNKTRKLTTQSCLSRDILGDDSNLLDLIHKIVPKDRMSTTTAVNKTATTNKSKPADTISTCDVIAEMSMYNNDNDDVSDTYTDEEIFKINEESVIKTSEKFKTPKQSVNVKKFYVVPKLQNKKIEAQVTTKSPEAVNKNMEDNGSEKRKLYKKSFWDTDSESDADFGGISRRISNLYDNSSKGNLIYNNVRTNHQHPRKNDIPLNRQVPEIPVSPNPKTKAIKPVEKDTGNNKKRNLTTFQAPQEPKITPPEKVTSKGNLTNNNVTTKSQHSRKNDKPINRPLPEVLTNPKTKAIKPMEKDTGNNKKRNLTTSQAPQPQESKITPENVKAKGNLTNSNVTTSSQHSRNNDKPINRPQPDIPVSTNQKTKAMKPVEKDTGCDKKRNLTTSQAPNVSPQEPTITPENVKAKGKEDADKNSNSKDNNVTTKLVKPKNSDTTNKNSNSKKNDITSKSVKTKNTESADKGPSSKKNNVTSRSANAKMNEDKDPVVTLKRIDKPSTKKPIQNTTLDSNNVTSKNKPGKTETSTNNPLKVKPQTGQTKLDKPSNETTEILHKSLRSRDINLSTSLSEKTNPSNNMSVTKKRGRPAKNKIVTKISKEDNSTSDISFTIRENTSPSKPNKRVSAMIKNAQMRSRRSNVSFTLISDVKPLNETTRVKNNSIGHKEVESLQLSTSFFLRSSNKSSRTWNKIQCCR